MGILARIETRLAQQSELMSRAGVRIEGQCGHGGEADLRSAVLRCIFCRHGEACRAWLDAGHTAIPQFCANGPLFERYRGRAAAA